MTTSSGALSAPRAAWSAPSRLGPLRITPANASVQFAVRFLGLTTIRGRFERIDGELQYDEARPTSASLVARAEVATIATGNGLRDAHLRSAAWFDARRHGAIELWSTEFARGPRGVRISAQVRMRGAAAPVEIDCTAEHEDGRAVVVGRFSIARAPYGVGPPPYGVARWDPRAYLVDDVVTVELRLRLDP